jgi:hypothetical protein
MTLPDEQYTLKILVICLAIIYLTAILSFSFLANKLRELNNRARVTNIIVLLMGISHQTAMIMMFGTDTMTILLGLFTTTLCIQFIQLYTLSIHEPTKSTFKKYATIMAFYSNPPESFSEIELLLAPSLSSNWWR